MTRPQHTTIDSELAYLARALNVRDVLLVARF